MPLEAGAGEPLGLLEHDLSASLLGVANDARLHAGSPDMLRYARTIKQDATPETGAAHKLTLAEPYWTKHALRWDLGNVCLVAKRQNRHWQVGAELVTLRQLLTSNKRAGLDLMYAPDSSGEGALLLQLKMKMY
jgi:hypothetical protein